MLMWIIFLSSVCYKFDFPDGQWSKYIKEYKKNVLKKKRKGIPFLFLINRDIKNKKKISVQQYYFYAGHYGNTLYFNKQTNKKSLRMEWINLSQPL